MDLRVSARAKTWSRLSCWVEQLGRQFQQQPHRQPDDVREVTLHALDQNGAQPLDRVSAGAVTPLAGGYVGLESCLVELPERHLRASHARTLDPLGAWTGGLVQDDPAEHRVGPPRQRLEALASLGRAGRFAEQAPVED